MSHRVLVAAALLAGATLAPALDAATPTGQAASPAAEQAHTDRMVRFSQIDRNADGKLSLVEFQTRPSSAEATSGAAPAPVSAKEMADRAARFKQADKDTDGFLTFEEFSSLQNMPVTRSP